jgi:hypothetical protein
MGDVLKWLKSIELRNMMLTLREEELNSIPDKKMNSVISSLPKSLKQQIADNGTNHFHW